MLKLGWHFFLRTNPKMNHVGESYPVPHRKTLFDETVNKNKEIKFKFSESNLGTYICSFPISSYFSIRIGLELRVVHCECF